MKDSSPLRNKDHNQNQSADINQSKSKCEQDHCYNIPYQDKHNCETPGKAVSPSFCLFLKFVQ